MRVALDFQHLPLSRVCNVTKRRGELVDMGAEVPQKDDVDDRVGVTSEGRRKLRQHLLFAFPRRKMGPVLVVLVLMLGAAEVVTPCMPGGLCPVPTDDPGVVNAIRVAEEDFNSRSSDLFHTAVSKVISAQTQVVWVFTYHLTLELRTTICKKSSVSRNCPFHEDPLYAKTMTCRFQVWDHTALAPMHVTESSCSRTAK
ncbi:cystatin-like [Mobula birostris]|uniref:cystatin-like n=1 Tax=Mobula birostris TaxID=1983395 RepID=UPI003B28976C